MSKIIEWVRILLGVENYDRRGEELIKKSIYLWNRGGGN